MKSALLLVPLLALAARGGCKREGEPQRLALPSGSAIAASARVAAPFEVVDVLDFGRRGVSRFAYCKATQEVFVSFKERDPAVGDALEQWSVPEARRVHIYAIESGFMADSMHPSPDCSRVVVSLFRYADSGSKPWEKHALVDPVKHAFVAADLEPRDDRSAVIDFGASGARIRITTSDGLDRHFVYDMAGKPAIADPAEFPPRKRGKLWVVASSKDTMDTHGLYYTDANGADHLVTQNHWHDNHGLTRDGQFVVTTTWDGEILAWSTRAQREVFRQKIALQYGYLAHDEANDRFLIADAMHDGTTKLRALVRTRGR